MMNTDLHIAMMTDSKQLFDAVTCVKSTAERRLSIDITAERESYRAFEICSIGLVRGYVNPADSLTKVVGNSALTQIIDTGVDRTPVVQCINLESVCQSTGVESRGGSVNIPTEGGPR